MTMQMLLRFRPQKAPFYVPGFLLSRPLLEQFRVHYLQFQPHLNLVLFAEHIEFA